MLIDLQLHSTYSDGYLSPTELVEFIASQGIKIASLTDHNTIGGVSEFKKACYRHDIKPIVGLELYIKLGVKKMNLLWYNFDRHNPELHNILRDSQIRRKNTIRKILEKITQKGIKIDINKTLDKYMHYLPINHLVDDILAIPGNKAKIAKNLNIKNPREAEIIRYYFYNPKIGVLRESYIGIERILNLRKKIGGHIILNHPGKHGSVDRATLRKLKNLGVDGLELISPHHSIASIMYLQTMARELDFITTGGSDFHRHEGSKYAIQNSFQYLKINPKNLRKIKKICTI